MIYVDVLNHNKLSYHIDSLESIGEIDFWRNILNCNGQILGEKIEYISCIFNFKFSSGVFSFFNLLKMIFWLGKKIFSLFLFYVGKFSLNGALGLIGLEMKQQ